VADRELPLQAREAPFVEHLGDEPEIAERSEPPVLADRDPRRLLPAVLQRVQPEVGQPRNIALRRADSEDAAHLADDPQLDDVVPSDVVARRHDHAGRFDDVGVGVASRPVGSFAKRELDASVGHVVRE